jgi:hypothetical protein
MPHSSFLLKRYMPIDKPYVRVIVAEIAVLTLTVIEYYRGSGLHGGGLLLVLLLATQLPGVLAVMVVGDAYLGVGGASKVHGMDNVIVFAIILVVQLGWLLGLTWVVRRLQRRRRAE